MPFVSWEAVRFSKGARIGTNRLPEPEACRFSCIECLLPITVVAPRPTLARQFTLTVLRGS